ncbi:DUF192 domain-containing protein [Roseicyclus persicicus]|uniref:DUF192 domain-containing protein n=1 Tax=Roseicyclus persicicus TaxID=2650661 RepID=A0A7X6H1T8_9RHOB|nr:DUF192 domain-containing protein [Roseibacterium persicicum]NKX46501.1 DUF192 domain-containing protein [Roseibacterium persicicum]
MRLTSLFAAAVLAVAVMPGAARAACSEDRVEIRGDFGTVRFRVAIADTPQERAQGLMRVPEMPRMSGMLFVYERPQSVSFWMENTLIPLDMIFADETGTVRRIHAEAVPLDRTPIPGGDDIQYVLEINGGLAAQLGLSEGDQMRHPAIDQADAAWPCAGD